MAQTWNSVPMSDALTTEQCVTVRTFLRTIVAYAKRTPAPDVNRFLQEYRNVTTEYRKNGRPRIPLAVGECAWPGCGNKYEYHRCTHQRYCSRDCARLAALAKQREYRKAR